MAFEHPMRVTGLVSAILLALALQGCATPGSHASASASTAVVATPAEFLVPGISRQLAEHRAATLSDVAYTLSMDVTGDTIASGRVVIDVKRSRDAGDLILDFRGALQDEVRANGVLVANPVHRDEHVVIPASHLKLGRNRVELGFTTSIGEGDSAIIRYDDTTDGQRYLYTVLVPANASKLFPSFDQASLKARVALEVNAPRGWTVIGNAPLRDKTDVGASATWRFEETPPIPTYVMSFAAGPWHTWHSTPAGERPMTLYARQSVAGLVDVEDFFALNRRSIDTIEKLVGVPYPYAKYDMVIAPAFPLGAMEHVGSVYYGESGALFGEKPTVAQRLNRDVVAYHEISHQWFGNLVTMKWFDDLWLKEGFSTYISVRAQQLLDPQGDAWKTFYMRWKPAAYATEQTAASRALWQPLENMKDAGGNYGTIVYNKAPSVLRQLSYFIGEANFDRGLTTLAQRHAHGNATWQDLIAAMEEVSGRSLADFGAKYFVQRGMAEVTTDLKMQAGKIQSLVLQQRPVNQSASADLAWPMKLNVRLGYSDRDDVVLPVELIGNTLELTAAAGLPIPDYVWPNDGDYGYGRFLLDAHSQAWVAANVGNVKDGLRRAQLWGTLWDSVRDTTLAPEAFLRSVIRQLSAEQDEQVSRYVLSMAQTVLNSYLDRDQHTALRQRWEAVLLNRSHDAAVGYGARKEAFDAFVATVATPQGLDRLQQLLDSKTAFDGKPLPAVSRWAVVTRLLARNHPQAVSRYQAEVASDNGPQATRQAYIARAAMQDLAHRDGYFKASLDDPSVNAVWAMQSFATFASAADSATRASYLPVALDRLEWIAANRSMAFLALWIRGFVTQQDSRAAIDAIDDYLRAKPDLAQGIRMQLLEARDEAERTVHIRAASSASP